MAAPTQEFPPWLTPSAAIVTDAAGVLTTSTTIIYLPLTYFGPSIPLGSLFIFGGSSSPATIVVPSGTATSVVASSSTALTTVASITTASTTATTSPAIPVTSTTPTTTSISSTSAATPSSITTIPTSASSSPSLSVSLSSALTTSLSISVSSAPTAPPSITASTTIPFTASSSSLTSSSSPSASVTPPATMGTLTKGQLVGVIVASILGLIFLFVFLLAMWLWCKGRRNRQSGHFSTITPIDEDYFVIGEGGRSPGEGSPRHSGEEADPFLQRSRNGGQSQTMQDVAAEMGSRPGVPRVPPPPTGSLSSSNSSSSNASGYGILLDRPSLGYLPSMPEETDQQGGHYLTEEEMQRLDQESVLPQDGGEEYTGAYAISKDPLLPPPRLLDPEHVVPQPTFPQPLFKYRPSHLSHLSHQSSMPTDAEDAALLTARRVKVEDLPLPGFTEAGPSRSGFLDAIGLTSLARLSWFKSENSPSPSPRNSRHSPTFLADPLSDDDLETGRTLFGPNQGPDSFGQRGNRGGIVGVSPDGDRPKSHVSGRSGNSGGTIYHDAQSSIPGTPPIAPLPRSLTPAELPFPEHAWMSGQQPPPPAYEDRFLDVSPNQSPSTSLSHGLPTGVDILDLPAPTALTHFTSSSSMKDTGTVSSIGLSRHPYPPGLDLSKGTKAWSDNSGASSPAYHHITQVIDEEVEHNAPVSIDMLEEEPPNPGDGWRSMAVAAIGGGFGEMGRRTTFGLPHYTHQAGFTSEQGSLHSMRSHVSPPSVRSTGSAPAARRDLSGSIGSNSSRPSVHSSSRSGGSGSIVSSLGHSIHRTGSITSDGRRRFGHVSPPLSAFGHGPIPQTQGGYQTPPRVRTPAAVAFKNGDIPTIDGPISTSDLVMPSAHISPDRASTIRTVTSGSATLLGHELGRARTRTLSAGTFGAGGSYRDVLNEEPPSPLSGSLPWATGLDSTWTPAA